MNRNFGAIIGILAGLAAGLMIVAAFRSVTAALPMLFAAPIAIYIASLGWGTVAGFLAAIVGAAGAMVGGTKIALFSALLMFLPAAWAGHLANLAQPSADGKSVIWYPLEGILVRLMASIAAGFIIAGFALGFDSTEIEKGMAALLKEFVKAGEGAQAINEENLEESAKLYAALLPLIMPAIWLIMHVAVFNISAGISRLSGKIARPKDDIPATANLPAAMIAWPLGGIAGMFITASPIYEIAAVFAGTGLAAFALTGLAEFHYNTRGKPGRGLLLFSTYLLIFMFTIPLFIFAILGMVRAWRRNNAPPGMTSTGSGSPPTTIN
ncbi:MAG: hypothetical protein ACR2O0_06005 [Rhizobiaceae bacterium]